MGKAIKEQPKDVEMNLILSNNMRLSMKKYTTANNNVLIIGGAGSGKTRYVIKPNIMQANQSFAITDPSGELLRSHGKFLMKMGYNIRLFSTSNMEISNCYNPFDYLFDENGEIDENKVAILATTYVRNCGKGAEKAAGDPFWEKSELFLMKACIFYLLEADVGQEARNFSSVLKLVQSGNPSSSSSKSGLSVLMDKMKQTNPGAKCLSSFKSFELAGDKTATSILVTCAADLDVFSQEKVKNLTRTDYLIDKNGNYKKDKKGNLIPSDNTVALNRIGTEKTALFINTPQADSTFNFLVSMLYSQLFLESYAIAEKVCPNRWLIVDDEDYPIKAMYKSEEEAKEELELFKTAEIKENSDGRFSIINGKRTLLTLWDRDAAAKVLNRVKKAKIKLGEKCLPFGIRCMLDEFANIGEIPNFAELLSTMRKYMISCTIVIQDITQLKDRYKDKWGTLVGNCFSIVFLGTANPDTAEFISKKMGKTTITVRSTSVNPGKGGKTVGVSYGQQDRDLMDPAEVMKLPRNKTIVLIQGFEPFVDDKFDLNKARYYRLTGDSDRSLCFETTEQEKYFDPKPNRPKLKKEKETINKAKLAKMNKTLSGEKKITDPVVVKNASEMKAAVGLAESSMIMDCLTEEIPDSEIKMPKKRGRKKGSTSKKTQDVQKDEVLETDVIMETSDDETESSCDTGRIIFSGESSSGMEEYMF